LLPSSGKEWRLRSLNRGDREALFRLLEADGWMVAAQDQESVLSWVVQHPELESFVVHDALSYRRLFALLTLSHRPQLKAGGRVASIDVFVVDPQQRHKGIGGDLLSQAMRRAEALGCRRIEMLLPEARSERHAFFENNGFVNERRDVWVLKLAPPGSR
jgi:GNAT superfamily N-acetyltransferase